MITKIPFLAYRKIRRGLLRLFPQKTVDLSFAGRAYPRGLSWLGTYSPPKILESKGVLPTRPVSHAFASREYFSVANAIVDPSMGEVYLDSGEFVLQSTPWHPYVPYPERRPPLILSPERISSPSGFIRIPSWTYYHQIVEYLPPYLFLRELFPDAKTIIPRDNSALIRSILDTLGIPYLTHGRPVAVNNLYFVGHGMDSGYPHAKDIEILRRNILPLAVEQAKQALSRGEPEVLYVSRVNAERSPTNEVSFVERLKRETNVRVIEAESIDFLDQVALFSNAKAVVGVHGAGLTNQVWMKPKSYVLELFDKSYSNPVFASLANVCGNFHEAMQMPIDSNGRPVLEIDAVIVRILEILEI